MARLHSVDVNLRVEQSTVVEGLFADPKVAGDGKAFLCYIGRHLQGAYRAVGLPPQKVIAKEHFGWNYRHLKRVIRDLKQRGYLGTVKTGFAGEFAYLLRAPQMELEFVGEARVPKGQLVALSKGPTGALSSYTNRYIVSFEKYDDDAREESSSSVLKNHGVTDAQIRTLRRLGRDLSPHTVAQEVAWVRACKRSSAKVQSEAALLYSVLRDGLGPPPDVALERAHAERLALDHADLARRRADAAAEAARAATPEAQAATRAAIARAKTAVRKGLPA